MTTSLVRVPCARFLCRKKTARTLDGILCAGCRGGGAIGKCEEYAHTACVVDKSTWNANRLLKIWFERFCFVTCLFFSLCHFFFFFCLLWRSLFVTLFLCVHTCAFCFPSIGGWLLCYDVTAVSYYGWRETRNAGGLRYYAKIKQSRPRIIATYGVLFFALRQCMAYTSNYMFQSDKINRISSNAAVR